MKKRQKYKEMFTRNNSNFIQILIEFDFDVVKWNLFLCFNDTVNDNVLMNCVKKKEQWWN